jgi:hypothetical protein
MNSIQFTACFGYVNKPVKLSAIKGGYYHIYINNFHYGQIVKRQGNWEVLLQDPSDMSMDDMDAIIDRIEGSY